MISATYLGAWVGQTVELHQAGHNVFWFDNGWYHAHDCKMCQPAHVQPYYFQVEKRPDNLLTFAYVWREGEDDSTHPPVKSFHVSLEYDEDTAWRLVSIMAAEWIAKNGRLVFSA